MSITPYLDEFDADPETKRVLAVALRTVFSALSGMRLLACLIVAPQRGYDEPANPLLRNQLILSDKC